MSKKHKLALAPKPEKRDVTTVNLRPAAKRKIQLSATHAGLSDLDAFDRAAQLLATDVKLSDALLNR